MRHLGVVLLLISVCIVSISASGRGKDCEYLCEYHKKGKFQRSFKKCVAACKKLGLSNNKKSKGEKGESSRSTTPPPEESESGSDEGTNSDDGSDDPGSEDEGSEGSGSGSNAESDSD